MEVESTGQSEVAAVSERGDDQSRGAAQVFIAVDCTRVRLHHVTVVGLFVPLVTQLPEIHTVIGC